MAKVFGRKDVYENDIFEPLIKDVNEAIVAFDKFDAGVKETASNLKKLFSGKQKFDSVKSINDVNNATKESNRLIKEALKLEQEKTRLNKLQSDALKAQEQAKQAELRTQKMVNQESKKTLTAYQQESRALTEMRNRYKDLAVQREKGNKLTRDERNEMRSLLTQINQTDASLKKIDATVGQHQRNVGNYSKALGGVKNMLGQLGVAFSVFQIGGFIGKTLVDFEENASNMAKTINVSVEEAKNLSRELAKIDTRTSIGDLQGIASIGGQLGIGAGEIVAFTESIDKLNVALGDEFSGGAEEITSVLGGLRNVLTDIKSDNTADDLLKIGNALNVLGAEGSATSPVVSDFAGRISGIGIPLGLTSDEILGLSATLQELNVNAERGGTAVGAILQRITRDTKGFAQLANMDVKKFEELLNTDLLGAFKEVTKGFSTLRGDSVKQSKVLEQLGLTGSGASEVFLKLGGSIDLLEKRVTQSGEALQKTDSITKEFEVKNNTLGATMDKLSTEFQKYVLGLDESGKLSGTFATVLQFLVNNMDALLNAVYQGAKAWVIYKTAMTALRLRDNFNDWRKLAGGIQSVTDGLRDGSTNAQKFGSAMKGIGLTALISLFFEIGKEINHVISGTLVLEQRLKRINELTSTGSKVGAELSEKYNKSLENRLKQIELMNVSEKEQTRLRKEAIENNRNAIKQKLVELRQTHASIDARRKEAIAERASFNEKLKGSGKLALANQKVVIRYAELENAVSDLTAGEKGYLEIIRALEANLNGLNDQTHDLNVEQKQLTISTEKDTKAKKEQTKAYKDANDEIERMASLIRETQDLTDEIAIDESVRNLQSAIESQLQSIELSGQYSLDIINARIQAEYDLRRAIIERQYQETNDANVRELQNKQIAGTATDTDYIIILEQEENARRKRDYELGKLDEEFLAKRKDINKQLEDAQEQHAEKISKSVEETAVKNYDDERKWIDLTTKYWEDNIDKRIKKLDELSEASRKQQDYLRGLAESGNINAQQSLAEEARIERQAEADKARLERRKQYVLAISAFLTEYTNRIEKGESSGQAFVGAFASKGALEAIINSLPAFFDGTESLGNGDGATPTFNTGKDDYLIRAHKGERIVPTSENKKIENMSNADLVKYAQMGKIAESIDAVNSNSWGNLEMLSELNGLRKDVKDLTKVIKDQPDRSHEFRSVVNGLAEFITTEKKGNVTRIIKDQYRTKR